MHAGAGIFLDRLGHEAGGDAVPARLRAHQPLQHDEIVGRLHARPCGSSASARTGRAHIRRSPSRPECLAPSRRRRCRKTAAPCRADGRPNRPRSCRWCGRRARRSAGCTRPSASRSLASRKNSSSKAPAGYRPFAAKASTCRASAWRGSEVIGAPSSWYIDISTWPRAGDVPCSGFERAGDRPAAQVAVAGIPDQPGLVDILAGDVEAEDRDRQMPAAFVEAHQFVAADDLAAADAVGVGQHDVEGLDLGMSVEKLLGFVGCRTGGRRHDGTRFAGRFSHAASMRRNLAEGRDQPVDLPLRSWPARSASCCGRARSARRD